MSDQKAPRTPTPADAELLLDELARVVARALARRHAAEAAMPTRTQD